MSQGTEAPNEDQAGAEAPSSRIAAEEPAIAPTHARASADPHLPLPAPAVATSQMRSAQKALRPPGLSGAWWSIPMLSAGICLISSAMIIQQVEENREMAWQRNKLKNDIEHIEKQLNANDDFITRIGKDSGIAERLAQRQMKMIRQGSAVLDVKGLDNSCESSPFRLITIPPPPLVKPYERAPGLLTRLFANPQIRLIAYGLGSFMLAVAIVLPGQTTRTEA